MTANTLSGNHVLVVDDEPLVCEAIQRILHAYGYTVTAVQSAQEALEVLAHANVDLCLSDLRMPGMDGAELLKHIRHRYPDVPVVILTGDGSIEQLRALLDAGASDFIIKPWRTHELPIIIERNIRRHSIWLAEHKRHLRQLNEAYSDMLEAMLSALEAREREIEGHCERVTAFTMILAEAMGVPHQHYPDIERGALLHDIGKIGIPDSILFKPGPLSVEEWEVMRQHPVIGYQMCMRVRSLRKGAQEIVLCHHERWDGSGYPQGLQGKDIPLGARIFAVADTIDAMTTNRPYRTALTLDEVAAELERHVGTQYDPDVVKAFFGIPASVWQAVIDDLRDSHRPRAGDTVLGYGETVLPEAA